VLVRGQPIDLTATEFRLLHFLARRPGWVFTREQILDGVHGDKYAITDRAVDVQVVALRRKLGPAGASIETVRGVGYRFKD
jgi:two-component system phosphate regulon response regulator PhoB